MLEDIMKEKIESVLVVCKNSVYELYSNSSDDKTKAYANRDDSVGASLRESHEYHTKTLEVVMDILDQKQIDYSVKSRGEVSSISDVDLVITVGGDGTVLDMARYISDNTPILGVNSDPKRSIGHFCYCTAENFNEVFSNISHEQITYLNRLDVKLNDARLGFALNDILVAHSNPAAYTRYQVKIDGKKLIDDKDRETIRSSGLLMCTAAGSTAFMYQEKGTVMPFESQEIQIIERSVRNAPFFFAKDNVEVESLSREGKIYFDGEHRVFDFTLGDKIEVVSGNSINLVGTFEDKREGYKSEIVPRRLV